ncbi:AAA family ATPase [Fusobacterium nucleatum]|nr:AAA family ATPase [Fusobacterium nucleatum]BEP09546.1 AAA family ATPase [Fusobacterium nucleatum]
MANMIMIIGESGTGKSTSIENLNEKETFIIQAVDKPLPFKEYKKKYPLRSKENPKGNRFISDKAEIIIKILSTLDKEKEIKNIIIDDSQYVMANEFMRRAKEKGFDKFIEIGQNFYNLIDKANSMREDINVIFLQHIEVTDNGKEKAKTIGRLIDEKICLEGRFTIVLATEVEDKVYYFRTQNNGNDTCKSPKGMFDELRIPNDLNYVIQKSNEYFN